MGVLYAKKYTGLKKVHHRRLWLIWAMLWHWFPRCSLFWSIFQIFEFWASLWFLLTDPLVTCLIWITPDALSLCEPWENEYVMKGADNWWSKLGHEDMETAFFIIQIKQNYLKSMNISMGPNCHKQNFLDWKCPRRELGLRTSQPRWRWFPYCKTNYY